MMPNTSTERVKAFRKRKKAEGLTEVRGAWSKKKHHGKVRDYAKKLGDKDD